MGRRGAKGWLGGLGFDRRRVSSPPKFAARQPEGAVPEPSAKPEPSVVPEPEPIVARQPIAASEAIVARMPDRGKNLDATPIQPTLGPDTGRMTPPASHLGTNGTPQRSLAARVDPVELERMHPLDPLDYVRPVLRRWWLVLGLVIAVAGATYAYYSHRPSVYQASTQVLLLPNSNAVSSILGSPGVDPTRLDTDAANIIRTQPVAALAAARIGYRGDPAALLGGLTVQSSPSSDFLTLVAEAPSGGLAAKIANGFADGYVALRTRQAAAQAGQAANLTARQLQQVRGRGPDASTARATLSQQLSQLRILKSFPQGGAEHINPAAPPTSAISPKPARNAEFGAVIALLAGILLCFALERIDRRIKRIDELELLLGAPVLAAVPHTKSAAASHAHGAAMDADIAEPFRMLRAVVRLAATGANIKTVLVTSGLAGEGKSTVARNLALAYCETGLSVLVVDCDLRGPMLDRILGGKVRELGLTDVLAGEATVEQSIVEVAIDVASPGTPTAGMPTSGNGVHPEAQAIDILPAGSARANPATLLETTQFRELLEQMRSCYDIVIIDSAPILPVSDSLPLITLVDGVLLVARDGVLTRGAAGRLSELIAQARPKHILGVVANDFPPSELGSYGMSYYGDSYGYAGRASSRKVRAASDS